ncbi:Cactin [Gracilariopsis chorda]|uniref:Splicing factor Cactin n=1 Tax=Gracilariopsis chorda TaxID=448386 RepID=A0A2V3J6V8_9FLOR|nr:Cactin [Gracilariopsis chorda]|eukprot:PXF49737.1 Cactin [Gracilariopsis chorda]
MYSNSEDRSIRKNEGRRRREEKYYELDEDTESVQPSQKRTRSSNQDEAPFVWRKKADLLRKKGIDPEREEARQRAELRAELASAKKRREQRERERAEWEAAQIESAREREALLNEGWHRQEASFHGSQHFVRQAIRIRDRRASDVDWIARHVRLDLRLNVGVLDMEEVLKGMNAHKLQGLAESVEEELDYVVDFSTENDNGVWNRKVRLEFWKCVRVCVKERVDRITGGMNDSVIKDVDDLLRGKSMAKLREMENEVESGLKGGDDDEDGAFGEVDFWSVALSGIRARIAALRLKELSEILMMERAERDAQQGDEEDANERGVDEEEGEEGERRKGGMRDGEVGRDDEEAGALLGEDEEENFADEVEVPRREVKQYAWNDKYRPRKPKYMNKVHTGYKWSKYNRTHYDHDNPPPKTVQGYKFNIFYPDLMDASKTPKFSVTQSDKGESAIITFHAGAPYEDIAFRIVNRRWERSHRRGYRCCFDRGVLQLWFNFERYFYKR